MLFWHALGPAASGETVREAAPGLAARGFRVLAVDGPGFGRSPALPPDRYELESLLALVDDLVDGLRLDRFAFMGHSWGGSIAVHYAARRPERVTALVLLDSGHVDYGQLPDVDVERPLRDWIAEARTRTWRWPSERAFADELAPGFRALDDRERRILHLRFFEGLTQSQIAQQVGISQMHVSRLIRRALEKIREEIAAEEDVVARDATPRRRAAQK